MKITTIAFPYARGAQVFRVGHNLSDHNQALSALRTIGQMLLREHQQLLVLGAHDAAFPLDKVVVADGELRLDDLLAALTETSAHLYPVQVLMDRAGILVVSRERQPDFHLTGQDALLTVEPTDP